METKIGKSNLDRKRFNDSDFKFLISIFQLLNFSSHGADFFRVDLVGYADFTGLAERIDGLAKIL